jgi:hypothetical protein
MHVNVVGTAKANRLAEQGCFVESADEESLPLFNLKTI